MLFGWLVPADLTHVDDGGLGEVASRHAGLGPAFAYDLGHIHASILSGPPAPANRTRAPDAGGHISPRPGTK